MNSHNAIEPDREEFMVMRPFRPLIKDATKEIREAGRCISPSKMLKLSGLGVKRTVSGLALPEQPNT